ncbi:MAG: hypothetical protein IAE91_08525 [Ignavibacteriaceae bacterium]|nr:hypothetical protein [Ignavibacteriaceae bacterium]
MISKETIVDVLITEFHRHKSLKIAEDSAMKKLHRIRAEYLGEPNYKKVKESLKAAFESGNDEEINGILFDIFSEHSSTRERNILLKEYYGKIFDYTGTPESIADLAAAFNPLSFRWMGLPKSVKYFAYDVNINFIELINFYFGLEGLSQTAIQRDILISPPEIYTDIAFLFKMFYCLEHRRRGAGIEVVKNVPSKYVAISFPTINLVNKKTDILAIHHEDILKAVSENNWKMDYINFANEIVVMITK